MRTTQSSKDAWCTLAHGGGGGALRLTSETSITVSGQLLANGGDGGPATNGGGGGGAGSGGVVWVQAPTLNIDGTVSAQDGYAGASCADEALPDADYRLEDRNRCHTNIRD